MMRSLALALTLASLASQGWAHGPGRHGHSGHGAHEHAAFAAGEPGDPKRLSRIVHVVMREAEGGGMSFSPAALAVKQGEQVKFVLRNAGKIEHEFVLDSFEGNAAHKAEMASNPNMQHSHPNERRLDVGKTGELVWRFTKAGTYEFACLIPGHYEAGMKGIVTVK